MQAVIEIAQLPDEGLAASAAFHRSHLDHAISALDDPGTTALAIVLPVAGPGHDDWRRAAARDLARAHAPKRVNIIAASGAEARAEMLAYLRDASGVTGQYLQAHE